MRKAVVRDHRRDRREQADRRRDQGLGDAGSDRGKSDERAVSNAQLVAALRERQKRNPDQPVVISADKDVRYEAVLKVMDELQRQNIRRVGLMVKPATGS